MKSVNSALSPLRHHDLHGDDRARREHGAVNLGQGFPDDEGPRRSAQRRRRDVLDGPNQYPPMLGLPALRQAVAAHDRRFYGLDVDWQTEVLVTSGATEALADCFLGLLEPGDEVVLLEPLYDTYLPVIEPARRASRVSCAWSRPSGRCRGRRWRRVLAAQPSCSCSTRR